MNRLMFLPCALLLAAGHAWAGGFQIMEHGATSTGMANARTAMADDINAIYFNPAAITELPGVQLQVGVTAIMPFLNYEAAGNPDPPRTYTRFGGKVMEVNDGLNDASAKSRIFTPIHLYAAWQIPDIGVSIGYGFNNPFGLGTEWADDWDGRFITIKSEIQTFFNQPTVAVDIAKLAGFKDSFKLSVAGGYNFVYGRAMLDTGIDLRVAEAVVNGLIGPEGKMSMTGSAIGHGWNAAIYGGVPGLLSFGASLRSGVSLPFEGDANFTWNDAGQQVIDNPALGVNIPDTTIGTITIDLPMNFNVGVAFHGVPKLTIAADFYYAMFRSYDKLDMQFDCANDATACDLSNAEPIIKDWGDVWQVSLGAQYQLLDKLVIRGGYGYVNSPVPAETLDPTLPDAPRGLYSLGAGYSLDWFRVDLGYMFTFCQRTKDNDVGGLDSGNPNGKANGTYKTVAHLLSLSLSARF